MQLVLPLFPGSLRPEGAPATRRIFAHDGMVEGLILLAITEDLLGFHKKPVLLHQDSHGWRRRKTRKRFHHIVVEPDLVIERVERNCNTINPF